MIYLFDWGNTLMKEEPDEQGPMYLWKNIALCDHADVVLENLSQNHALYLATNAGDSDEADIRKALIRGGINRYITGIFCHKNLGVMKPSAEFFNAILAALRCRPEDILMVGNDPENDVRWARDNGARAVLYDPSGMHKGKGHDSIADLRELCRGLMF